MMTMTACQSTTPVPTEEINVTKTLNIAATLVLVAACQSPTVDPIKPEDVLLPSAESEVYQPILLTRSELLSLSAESRDMIVDHNNVYWCRNPAARPRGFDITICESA